MSDAAEEAPGEGEPGAPTVFVIDDDPVVRAAVANAAATVDLKVEPYANALAFLDRLEPQRPGCVLLDVRLPGMSGLELQIELTARGALWPIIFITGFADVPTAVQVLRAGALDLLEKPLASGLLVERIHEAIAIDRGRRETAANMAVMSGRLAKLTPREREVLELITAGQASKTIAQSLTLSRKTVETHRAKLMVKTGASSLAELIRLGLLLDPSDSLARLLGSAYGNPFSRRDRR